MERNNPSDDVQAMRLYAEQLDCMADGAGNHLRGIAERYDRLQEASEQLANAMDTALLANKPMFPADLVSRRGLVTEVERLLKEADSGADEETG